MRKQEIRYIAQLAAIEQARNKSLTYPDSCIPVWIRIVDPIIKTEKADRDQRTPFVSISS